MQKLAVLLGGFALLLGAASVEAGRVPGPGKDLKIVQARSTVTYYETFRANELAVVSIVGDGSTDLDIYVYDENGNFITAATGLSDVETVTFTPAWTGVFRIEVRNLGSTWNEYALATDSPGPVA